LKEKALAGTQWKIRFRTRYALFARKTK
jgi:hypothetical protein